MNKRIYIGEGSESKDYVYVEVRPNGLYLVKRRERDPMPHVEIRIVSEPLVHLNEEAFKLKIYGFS